MTTIYPAQLVPLALAQQGDRYIWGSETVITNPDPTAFDCSELVQYMCGRGALLLGDPHGLVGQMPDGSWIQRDWCRNHHTEIPYLMAIRTYGALLFRIGVNGNHVAISLGNGETIEARGRAYGVNKFPATNRTWTSGGMIPGVTYRAMPVITPPPPKEEDPVARKMVFPVDSHNRPTPLTHGPEAGNTPTLLLDDEEMPIFARKLTKAEVTWYRAAGMNYGPMPVEQVENLAIVRREVDKATG